MASRSRQLHFDSDEFSRISDSFGGGLLKKSHAKTKRPLHSKFPIHLVFRARRGVLRLPTTKSKVEKALITTCRKHGVKLFEWANVGYHIHAVIQIPHVRRWAAFIRELSGTMALAVAMASPQLREFVRQHGLWLQRPFTRIVRGWNKAFRTVRRYVELNEWEARGFISRKDIKTLKDLEKIFGSPPLPRPTR